MIHSCLKTHQTLQRPVESLLLLRVLRTQWGPRTWASRRARRQRPGWWRLFFFFFWEKAEVEVEEG